METFVESCERIIKFKFGGFMNIKIRRMLESDITEFPIEFENKAGTNL